MRNILLMLVLVPGISIIFAYTKANIWSFWLGFVLCIFLQSFILFSYCFIKVQKAYRDSFTIRLQQNYNMNPSVQYPFPPLFVNDKIYLNRYTEQAFLNNKKQVLKSPAFDEKLQDLTFNEVSCKKEIQQYIDQMHQKYKCLNKFNEALILFGVRIKTISDSALLIKTIYPFAKFQTYFKDHSFSAEFREEERRAFNELKIKLKSPKLTSTNTLLGKNGESGSQEIVLPTWSIILSALEKIGAEFQQIEDMKNSNSQMMEMIQRKIFEDYQVLEKEMSDTMRSLQQIRQNLSDLKQQQKNLQKYETKQRSDENNSDVMYWLKKQYFQFTNLTLRIKQNQNSYKRGVQKMRYFSSKITTFYKQQKDRYDSIVITRYISFLDTYSISLQESLNALCAVFGEEGYAYNFRDAGPPKVKEMIKSKNMNEVIAAELTYHEEYFERADYYKRKITLILDHLDSLSLFLIKLKDIYSELVFNLNVPSNKKGQTVYFRILYEQLGLQSRRIFQIVDNLHKVNLTLQKENQSQLLQMHKLISINYEKSHRILSKLRVQQGPMRQRYKLVKTQLTQIYKETQEMITSIKYFQQVYQKHQSRIKKILVVSFIQFINYQKKMICNQGEGDYLRKTADLTENALEDVNMLDATKIDITEDLSYENQNRLETGYMLSEEYRALLNRFLFVAYTEWSQSQLFRATIAKEIYIALNQDYNENLQEINIDTFELQGQPPELLWAKEIYSQQGEFIIDLNISFRGRILMNISTTYVTFINIPIGLQIKIEEFYCVLRLCFIVNQLGCSWFSFVGEPIVKVSVGPKVGTVEININSITKMFESIILNKLKESVYPIKKKITIPLYKKDQSYEVIQNRFKSGMDI